ncbi:MAG TPA: dihydrodipicolinate synthase family protein [Bryobacteraceae bacterium]|jgi:dihydrodipicolinate synthase/N-acetylneuraminate lyase|nr:dihydrodipicolinate synthase family protein [Bryobacteraceae bacterium]
MANFDWRARLREGVVIPAHPLALTSARALDEKRQVGLTEFYIEAGAGGIAVGVHTTQFAIREKGLYEPVLRLAADTALGRDVIRIAGAFDVHEAECAARLGYHAALLIPRRSETPEELLARAREVGRVLPIVGFYLQPAVGGCVLPRAFWRQFALIESVIAIKVAPFHRYQTLDVLDGLLDSGRGAEIALYTGNDDHIVLDLITAYRGLRFVGGLLGQWAVWTRQAVEMLDGIHRDPSLPQWRNVAGELTAANAAIFDVANGFRGCIAGVHEILRRQGLMEGIWCLDPDEGLSEGQMHEIDRVCAMFPQLADG